MPDTQMDRCLSRLWALQDAAGFNDAELSRRLGVNQSTVHRLKKGKRDHPSLRFLLAAFREFPELTPFLSSDMRIGKSILPDGKNKPRAVRATVAERLDRLSIPEPNSGCWLWLGCLNQGGYGHIGIGRRPHGAHRVAYETFVGPIPDGLEIDHLCRNRACINPTHLEAVTPLENVRRSMVARGLSGLTNTCKRGHVLDSGNTYVNKQGGRLCRTCNLAHHRAKQHGIPFNDALTQEEARARKSKEAS